MVPLSLAQLAQCRLGCQHANLLFIVVVDKGLDCLDCGVHRLGPQQSGQGAGKEPGKPPNREQVAVAIPGQPSLNLAQVILLSSEMTLGKCAQRGVARNSQNTLIYADRSDFAGVVGHQIG